MLIQVLFFVFVMFGMLSLVVDMGFARLTQVQMQNAAEAAAIEGLRGRDAILIDGEPDGYASDCERRIAVRNVVRWTFDDDFIVTTNGEFDPTLDVRQFGAGPRLDLEGGETDLNGLQTVSQPGVHVYKPDPQLNQEENSEYGDMVSGSFMPDDPQHVEDNAYERTDFAPGDATMGTDCEPSGDGPLTDASFLVRLRRVNDFQRQDLDDEPGVSSGGPPLPLLFGRVSTISGADPQTGYSVRRDGLTVRATAIAHIQPARAVGMPTASNEGVTPFLLSRGFLESVDVQGTDGAAVVLCPVDVVTFIHRDEGLDPCDSDINRVGQCAEERLTAVGHRLGDAAPGPCAVVTGYAPAYGSVETTLRVLGFFRVRMWQLESANPGEFQIAVRPQRIAPANATGHIAGMVPSGLSAFELGTVLAQNKSLAFDALGQPLPYGALLVPVLVR